MGQSGKEIQAALAKPFAPEDLEWRLQQTFEDKMRGIAVPYVTNRAIQNRLDDVVGPENWYNKYRPWIRFTVKVRDKEDYKKWVEKEVISQLCGISIYFPDRDRWICKCDGAEMTDIEAVKGGLSDSMKRAAVQWGIGRVLYSMDVVFVDIERKGKSYVIKSSERSKLDQAYLGMLKSLGLTPAPAGGLQSLLAPQNIPESTKKAENPPLQSRGAASQGTGETVNTSMPQPAKNTAPVEKGPTLGTAPAAPSSAKEPQDSPAPYEYTVYSAMLQKGMNTQNTLVILTALDGKQIKAFVRGVHPALRTGARLNGTRLTVHKQDTVIFYVLEDYRIVEPQQQAA